MPTFAISILGLYACIGIAILIALVYLIIKRNKDRKNEHFEQRDN